MEDQNVEAKPEIKKRKINVFRSLTYLVVLALGIGVGVLISQQKPAWFGLSKGAAAVQAEVDGTIAKVGKLITLPADEKPTVATVTDVSKIKNQPFFQNAKNGDIVLVYTKAQKAILYRPTENKIVEVGAVNINNQAVQTSTPSPSPKPTK
jgi:hypothetical protein